MAAAAALLMRCMVGVSPLTSVPILAGSRPLAQGGCRGIGVEGQSDAAAAADLKFAMDELVVSFKKSNPSDEVDVIYGSSGKFHTQIQQGAPYDMFFSADIGFPRELAAAGTIFQPVVLARRIEQVPHQGRALLQVVEQCSWSLQER